MYKTRRLSTRMIYAPAAGSPGVASMIGEEQYWQELILPDCMRLSSDEVLEELGDDKEYILAKLDEANRQWDNQDILWDLKSRSAYGIIQKACTLHYGWYNGIWDYRYSSEILKNFADDEVQRHLTANKWCIVTRSKAPEEAIPWKRFGYKTFRWVVPMIDAYKNTGRRIEEPNDTIGFNTRKEALAFLYKG